MPSILSSFSWSDSPNTAHLDPLFERQRWSNGDSIERLCRGPAPWPDWLVTAAAAVNTDLGLLKSGKEADFSLLERAVPDDPTRPSSWPPDATVTQTAGSSAAAPARRAVASAIAATPARSRGRAEVSLRPRRRIGPLGALRVDRTGHPLHGRGPVPYPVQVDGTEILMEFISEGDAAAPRLHQTRLPQPRSSRCSSSYERPCRPWPVSA